MLITHADLFDGRSNTPVTPWRPRALERDEWPPDYRAVYAWRIQMLNSIRSEPEMLIGAKRYYSTRPAEFIMHWMDTYNPRLVGNKWIPFIFFKRQSEFIEFVESLRAENENGLVEKCRDIGATWLACAYSVWSWLFLADDATGWGTRKQELVDKLGDPDSIFEKIRLLIKRLPAEWLPEGYKPRDHSTFMKLVNPANGATITGESGDNIGRGGRKAQPLHTPIVTPHGLRPIGTLRVGDRVMSPTGQPVRVTGIQDHGWRENYRVTFNDGSYTECDLEHLWQVSDKTTRKNLARSKKIRGSSHSVLTTREIASKLLYGKHELNFNIPMTKPVEFEGLESDQLPLHPYILGVLIGDGCLTRLSVTNPTFVSFDDEIVQRVIELCPDYTKVKETTRKGHFRFVDTDKSRNPQGRSARSILKNVLSCVGVANCNSYNKRIPHTYMYASIEARHALLQGIMDTDGYVSDREGAGKVCIGLSNVGLSNDVRFLVETLGGVARQTVRKTKCADSYTLVINLPAQFNPFHLTRKATRVGVRAKYQITRAIKSVELVGFAQMRCITVDAPNGLYLTDHCIVTHNSRYWKDEAAHYERPEKIEAALGDNTNVQIDMSSVNGLGNVFHRRRENGVDWAPGLTMPPGRVRVFVFDWRDHPEKTQEWYDLRKARFESEGLQHVFAQEVDRNYSAAIGNTIINAEWLQSCVDAHLHIPCLRIAPPDDWMAGLDVADKETDGDRNALAIRQWIILRSIEEWGERDQGVTTRRMVTSVRSHPGIAVQYDSIGVGAGVKTEYNRLIDDGLTTREMVNLVSWNAGASVVEPWERIIPNDDQSLFNRDFFGNFKAQAWWSMRTRCYKTWRARTMGDVYPADQLISFDSTMPLLHKLTKELAQATHGTSTGLRMIVNKKPDGTSSPNLADSAVMAYFPAPDTVATALTSSYSG